MPSEKIALLNDERLCVYVNLIAKVFLALWPIFVMNMQHVKYKTKTTCDYLQLLKKGFLEKKEKCLQKMNDFFFCFNT